MTKGKLAVIAVIAVLVVAFLWFDLGRYLSLEFLESRQSDIDAFYREHPVTVLAAYFVAYVAITGLSLPGAAIMTLAGGAVFGLLWGTVVVSFASTLGATVAFIVSRYILRDGIQRRYGDRLKTINAGVERDGGVLPVYAAAGAGVSVLRDQPGDGAHPDANPHVRNRQPGRDAPGDHRVRQCRHPARANRIASGNSLPCAHRLVRAPWNLSSPRQVDCRRREDAARCPAARRDVVQFRIFVLRK